MLLLDVDTDGSTITDLFKTEIEVVETANISATSIKLRGYIDVFLPAGTSLSFINPDTDDLATYRKQIVLLEDTTIEEFSTNVKIYPLPYPIQQGDIAEAIEGILPLFGLQTIDLSSQETQVETTNFRSGRGVNNAFVRNAKTCNVSGIALAGDKALETIVKPVGIFSSELFGRDVYVVITMPNGERFEGIAKIGSMSLPSNQNDVQKFSFNLLFQGDDFQWYPPFTFI
jgi:hypothetical protein